MDELERLSALETLKGLEGKDRVTLAELVDYLESRNLWHQFSKITMGDLRTAFPPEKKPKRSTGRRRKKERLLEDELGAAVDERAAKRAASAEPEFRTEDVARRVLPFLEANGDVTVDEIAEYVRLDSTFADLGKRALRTHLERLVKEGRLERVGSGRNAVYSAL
ncbi:MAG: hypothetical protein D6705_08150 [Deltaproteobacteria bacterium]|nr:MAG: hypothetical protein D6705_08150 [Deltaproteobacteria bacterium]